jgi:excisionase family DNA binding protein
MATEQVGHRPTTRVRMKSELESKNPNVTAMGTVSKVEQYGPKRPANPNALLTVEEVAALLRVPVSWIYGRTRSRSVDRLPGIRLGKYWRFREADLEAWIERQRSGGRVNA